MFARDHGVYLASTYTLARPPAIRPTTLVFAGASNELHVSISPANSASRCSFDPQFAVRQVTIHGYRFKVQQYTTEDPRGQQYRLVLSSLCSNHADGLLVDVVGETGKGAHPHLDFPPTDVMERLQLLGTNPADWVTNPMP